ncbi:MAG: HlyD family efflux transporter periplasmic adaptor subunit [Deltaproteobacteria bacterium]|nr:HlyD family efflux transporter periplasmic adaptor subunit [Deltaproteobacteria bacterium]
MNEHGRWRRWLVWTAAAGAAAGLWWYQEPGRNALPAVVGAARHQLGALEAARLQAVFVKPGDAVRAGQPLAQFDCSAIDADLGVARAQSQEQLAEVEALAVQLAADARRRRLEIETEAARVRAAIASAKGLQQAQQAELNALSEQMQRLDQAIRTRLAEADKVAALRSRQLRLISRTQQAPETVRAWVEVAEQVRSALDSLDGDDIAVRVRPLRARVETQSQRIQQLLERQARCTVRSPADGQVSSVLHAAGDAISPGSTVAVVVGTQAAYVTAYLAEDARRPPRVGEAVVVAARQRPGAAGARGVVARIGPEIVELPARLWYAPNRPQYGRPVHIEVDAGADLLPGELASVRGTGGEAQAAPVAAALAFPARVPGGLGRRTRLELSGLVWLPGRSRFLLVSDDTGLAGVDEGAPWVFSGDAEGQLDPEPLLLDGVEAVSDLESATRAPDGTIYLLASQSVSRKGNRPVKRQWLLRVQEAPPGLRVIGKLALYDQLLARIESDRRAELGVSVQLDIEGMAWHAGGLLLGLKSPLDAAGRARLWYLADADSLLAATEPPAEYGEKLSLFGALALPSCASGAAGGISDLYLEGKRLYVLSTLSEGPACGSAWRVDLPLGQASPHKLADWPDLRPEGIARAGSGPLLIAFDNGAAVPSFAHLAQ